MDKKALREELILRSARNITSTFGEYKLMDELRRQIADIMDYPVNTFYKRRDWGFQNKEDWGKVDKIIKAMESKGYIKISKAGNAYKVL